MDWEEYFQTVFKFGVRVRSTDKKSAWERVRRCFDYYCDGVPCREARALMRKVPRPELYKMLDEN